MPDPRAPVGVQVACAVNALDVQKFYGGLALTDGSGWDDVMAEAVETRVLDMNAHGLILTLNALCGMPAVADAVSARAGAVGDFAAGAEEGGWRRLARVTETLAPTMSEHQIAMTLSALSRLKPLGSAIPSEGWTTLARRLLTTLPTMKSLQVINSLRGAARLPGIATELAADPEARQILSDAVEGVDASRLKQKDRDALCDACEVFGLKAPPR